MAVANGATAACFARERPIVSPLEDLNPCGTTASGPILGGATRYLAFPAILIKSGLVRRNLQGRTWRRIYWKTPNLERRWSCEGDTCMMAHWMIPVDGMASIPSSSLMHRHGCVNTRRHVLCATCRCSGKTALLACDRQLAIHRPGPYDQTDKLNAVREEQVRLVYGPATLGLAVLTVNRYSGGVGQARDDLLKQLLGGAGNTTNLDRSQFFFVSTTFSFIAR